MKDKILLISLSNIGDAIMTTPVISYLYEQNKNAVIDIVCDKKTYEIFRFCPYVNKIFIKNKEKGFIGNLALIKTLRQTKYKIAVDLRTDILLFFVKSKKKFFKKNNSKIHSAQKHFSAVESNYDFMPKTTIWIPKKIDQKIKKLIPKTAKKILSLALGANSEHKIWPINNYLNLVNKLDNKFDLIILVGDHRDEDKANDFCKMYSGKTINFCGKMNLIESASLIKLSDYFIGNDSGLGHIAAAVETPSFTIFGKENPFQYHPWGTYARWYQNKDKDINKITPSLIFNLINKITS
jgi:heptosyltransferase-3